MDRIKATLRSDGSALVALPTGEMANIWPDEHHYGCWFWSIVGAGDEQWPSVNTREGAYRRATMASARRTMKPARAVGFSVADALRLEGSCSVPQYNAQLKTLLVRGTGHGGFSVRRGRGTASQWIHVQGTDDLGERWIAAIFPQSCGSGESIPPTRGYRAHALCLAAGIDASGVRLAEHSWSDN